MLIEELESRGYRWAYRVVDSRSFGLPQRRRRVFLVASRWDDPRDVLLVDDAPHRIWPEPDMDRPIGFYWTEGRSGKGLTGDAIPPMKAGSGLGIPCPPAVLLPSGRVVTPTIEAAERFQGFPRGWTAILRTLGAERFRWRLVGNSVSVPVAAWIGRRLLYPGSYNPQNDVLMDGLERWPKAGWNMGQGRMVAGVSEYPMYKRRGRLSAFGTAKWPDLSTRALRGFVCGRVKDALHFRSDFCRLLRMI